MQVFLDDKLNAVQDSLRIIKIIEPLIFNRPKPTQDNGYLIYDAYMKIVSWYISFNAFDYAGEWVNNIFAITDRMIETNPNEDDYFRWKAHGLKLLADIEFGQNKITAAIQYLAKSIEELQSLYKKYPNKVRLEELIQSLEYRLKLAEKIDNRIWMPLELWKNELSKLKGQKIKTEDFTSSSEVELNKDVKDSTIPAWLKPSEPNGWNTKFVESSILRYTIRINKKWSDVPTINSTPKEVEHIYRGSSPAEWLIVSVMEHVNSTNNMKLWVDAIINFIGFPVLSMLKDQAS